MTQSEQADKKNKTKLVGFRVDENVFSEIEDRAMLAGKSTNDWCRDELLARLAEGSPLTMNEDFIHSQILRFGRMTFNAFDLLANGNFTKETWQQVAVNLEREHTELARKYFSSLMLKMRKARE
jgi:hypothetical protein